MKQQLICYNPIYFNDTLIPFVTQYLCEPKGCHFHLQACAPCPNLAAQHADVHRTIHSDL